MNHEPDQTALNPELFARVWQRVTPDQDTCPVEATVPEAVSCTPSPASESSVREEFPLREAAEAYCPFLRQQLELELWHRRHLLALAQISCFWRPSLISMASQSRSRAKRLSAALFLISGGWYHCPRAEAVRCSSGKNSSQELRALFRSSQQLEADYRRISTETCDPQLSQLCGELAGEHQIFQHRIRHLLEQL